MFPKIKLHHSNCIVIHKDVLARLDIEDAHFIRMCPRRKNAIELLLFRSSNYKKITGEYTLDSNGNTVRVRSREFDNIDWIKERMRQRSQRFIEALVVELLEKHPHYYTIRITF